MGRRREKDPESFKRFEVEIPVESYEKLAKEATRTRKSKNDVLALLIDRPAIYAPTKAKSKTVQFTLSESSIEILSSASKVSQKTKSDFIEILITEHQKIHDTIGNIEWANSRQREMNALKNEMDLLKGAMAQLGESSKDVLKILRKEV